MKTILYVVIASLCSCIASFRVSSQTVYMKHYTINDGLAGNHVYMCHQDDQGYLWMATTSGLSKFDGKKFKNFDYNDGLIDNEVLFVVHDADNNLWVKSFAAGQSVSVIKDDVVKPYNNDPLIYTPTGHYISLTDAYYSNRYKIAFLNGYHVMIAIKKGKNLTIKGTPFINSCFFETDDGKICAGDGCSIYTIKDTIFNILQNLELGEPFTRLSYYHGMLYIITGKKLNAYKYSAGHFQLISSLVMQGKINLVHANQYGVWVTYADTKGSLLFKDIDLLSKPLEIKIPGFVNYFTDDNEGGFWLSTTDNGVFYMPDPGVINYTVADGLSSSVVYAAAPLPGNRFWLGYNTGKAQLVQVGSNKVLVQDSIALGEYLYNSNFVLDIIHHRDVTYFLSRANLIAEQSHKINIIPTQEANKSMLIINDTLLGIGAWGYDIYNLRSHHLDRYRISRVYAQATDSSGDVWLGSVNGLYKIATSTNRAISTIKALDDIKINALAVHGPDLLVGTQNNGLFIVKNNTVIAQYTYRNTGLPSNTIRTLALKDNTIWIGTNKGILHCTIDYDSYKLRNAILIDHNDGLLSSEINQVKITDAATLITTYDGITLMGTPRRKALHYAITDLYVKKAGDTILTRSDSITTTYDTRGLEIGFQTVAFKYGDNISYRYRLEPFDKDWKNTTNNIVQYTNLPPGSYHFSIIAYDKRGNQSTPRQGLYIEVIPLYWQTTWFRVMVVLMIVILICLVLYRYYITTRTRTTNKLAQGRFIAQAKLEALRSQLKPHFIFNSLNAIKDYIYTNKNDDAANLLQGFAVFIRNGLNLSDSDFITIAQEAAFLKQYLHLEQLKCDQCFDYNIEVPVEINHITIPSLITQPFVENAVIHGVRMAKQTNAVLHIAYALNGKDIVCRISDNGIGVKHSLKQKKKNNSIGTNITIDRINYFKAGFNIDMTLDVQDRSDLEEGVNGTIVVITIKNATQLPYNENNTQNFDHR